MTRLMSSVDDMSCQRVDIFKSLDMKKMGLSSPKLIKLNEMNKEIRLRRNIAAVHLTDGKVNL